MATAFVTLLIVLLGSLWWWSGRDDSLSQTLQRVARWLPEGQSLAAREVTGSLRAGGRIGWLQWRNQTTRVEIKEAQIGWQLSSLLSRTLRLGEVHVAEVQIASTPDPEKKPTEPLQGLTLPVKIDLPFAVDRIVWQGPPEAVVEDLKGRYRYDGNDHALQVASLRFADGRYRARLQLQGAAPMWLDAQVQGDLLVPNPMQPEASIAVQAQAQARGTLATEAARIEVTAHANAAASPQKEELTAPTESGNQSKKSSKSKQDKHKKLEKKKQDSTDLAPMQADVQASAMPWAEQPLLSAKAVLQNLDVAAFWPRGPRTLLNGELLAGPDPTQPGPASWKLDAHFENNRPAPWDRQGLPLQSLSAQVRHDGRQWQVPEAQLLIGKGSIRLQGSYTPASQLFEGLARIEQLNPADLYSTLEAAPLQGEISARAEQAQRPADAAEGAAGAPPKVVFAADLHATTGSRSARPGLRIQTLAARGQWQQPLLQLSQLQLQALQASVNASQLEFDTDSRNARAKIKADLPGAHLQLDGQIGPEAGQGRARLDLTALSSLVQWLGRLPGLERPLAGARADGSTQLQLDWRGGWGPLLQRLHAQPGTPLPASGLQLNAGLQAQKLRYQAAGQSAEQALTIPSLQFNLAGSPENARLSLTAQASQAAFSAQLDTALQAGLASTGAPLDWQASLEKLQARIQTGQERPGPWLVQLQPGAPVQIAQRTSHARGQPVLSTRYQLSAGRLQVTPPDLGMRRTQARAEPLPPALLAWDDSSAVQAGNGRWSLRSTGRAQGIALAWVDAFSLGDDAPPLAAAGLSGDLSFNGQWDLDTMGQALKAQLVVERAGGDLRLAVDDGAGTTVVQTTGPSADKPGRTRTRTIGGAGMRARIQQARLSVQASGSDLTAQVLWESERAGSLNGELRTRLAQQDGSWTWPEKAPLQGRLTASMPDIGLWALFAPPGWRVKGTLAADATISGDHRNPQWQGNLQADELSIASVLDGVDLQGGMLRARLQGTRLDITELRLKGGKGSNARILGYSGNLGNAPEDGGEFTGSGYAQWTPPGESGESGLSMNLQAQARKLQVLVRADRQVSISGNLQARLEQGQFVLRGDLGVDRAAIILPEESAPSLDKDVVVHTAASRKAEEEARQKKEREARRDQARATPRKLPNILVKLDLGRDFALQGYGITTRLRGQLEVQGASRAGGPPRVTGEIRTEQGRYRAWGQSLDVESGLIRFNGPYDNPSLDILAIRPNIAVRAGVQVLGTASAPRVLLYSDPDLPDAEKLSWVVMGRDPALGGAESALLQQAALALLAGGNSGSGKIAGSLGLDEVGFKGPGAGEDASGAALTLGKRLSSKLYLTYEQSLSGAMGTIYIFYDLSRRLTLRAQTGVTSAIDLVYTMRRD
jgi:translocation and assembly module TamB